MPKIISAHSNRADAPAVKGVPCYVCGQEPGSRCITNHKGISPSLSKAVHQNRAYLYGALQAWNDRRELANGRTCNGCALYSDHEPGTMPIAPWRGQFEESETIGYCDARKTRLLWECEDGSTEEAAVLRPMVTDKTPACPKWEPAASR